MTDRLSHDEMLAIAIGDEIGTGPEGNLEWLPVFKPILVHQLNDGRSIVYVNVGRPSYDIQKAFPTHPVHGGSLARHRYRKAQTPQREPFYHPMKGNSTDRMIALAERKGALEAHLDAMIEAVGMADSMGDYGRDILARAAARARALLDQLTREADEDRAQRILADMPDRRS